MIQGHALGLALAVLTGIAGLAAARGEETIEGPARVIDGDTIEVSGIPVRLFGVDAPERDQSCSTAEGSAYPCGAMAEAALTKRTGIGSISCRARTRDHHHRVVAICYDTEGDDIGAWLVENGFAVAFRKYSIIYVEQETRARNAHRGVWVGQFITPAEWRALHYPSRR